MVDDHVVIEFCDYLRLMVGGNLNPFEIENLMDIEIETHHSEGAMPVNALARMADSLPAYGIVAAVMGWCTPWNRWVFPRRTGPVDCRPGGHLPGILIRMVLSAHCPPVWNTA